MNNVDSFKEFILNIEGYQKAESVVLDYIKELDYPDVHPLLEYPNTNEGIALFQIILLKLYNVDDDLIIELLKKCRAVENNIFNYDRYRQGVNEVIVLYYFLTGIFINIKKIPRIFYPEMGFRVIDNDKIPEYSIELLYRGDSYFVNIEVKTLSCEVLTQGVRINDGDKYIIPYYKDEEFILQLQDANPDYTVLTDKCCLFQLQRNINKIKAKFEGENLTKSYIFNIGVIFIDRSSSFEQFYSYLFNNKFGLLPRTRTGNIDALIIITMDAKVDLYMDSIYNSGYVKTLLFKDDNALKEICKYLRADNFIYLDGKVRQDVFELSKKEYEKIKILNRDGFLNVIPADTSEDEINEYLKFLNGDIPRNI